MTGKKNEQPLGYHRLFPFPHIRWNYPEIARRMLAVQPLPQGALPIYDRDLDIIGTVLKEDE